jgi:arginyl-tRNA synthetase
LREYLAELFQNSKLKLDYLNEIEITFNVPKIEAHGDYSTNAAMILTKKLKRNPREIAQEIIDHLDYDDNVIEKVEIAGPGFINFHFQKGYVAGQINEILDKKQDYGRTDTYQGKNAQVEFVSANPTGPLTVGHGRNAVVGDTVANLLEWIGYEVDREYYFNNAGRQMRVLGESLKLRYLQELGDDIEFPEDYYQGEYLSDIAKKLVEEHSDKLKETADDSFFQSKAEEEIFEDIKNTLANIDIVMDNFFNEKTLYENKDIDKTIKFLRDKNLAYDQDGAVWFKLTEMGGEQDKVIVKSTGEPTYRLPDIVYHANKFERGYDLMVDIFGSDHNATYPDVLAGIKALGYDTEKVKVLIHQFVTILDKGKVMKMSTRKANFITLDELTNAVGKDVVRYFFNIRSISSHLNFDIDLARKQSDENPVFYLQYAHARISSILRMTADEGLELSTSHLESLSTDIEQKLIKKLYQFKEEILYAAENLEPHKVANYLEDLAALFHKFYTECRVIGSAKELAEARIALIMACQIVLKNGLSVLGVDAPDRM